MAGAWSAGAVDGGAGRVVVQARLEVACSNGVVPLCAAHTKGALSAADQEALVRLEAELKEVQRKMSALTHEKARLEGLCSCASAWGTLSPADQTAPVPMMHTS